MYGIENNLGLRISQLIHEKGWTQSQLANKVGISQNHVSRLEKNKMTPRRGTLESLADALEVRLEDLESLALVPDKNIGDRLAQEDPDLAILVSQIPLLTEEQKHALRITLRSMIGFQKVREFTTVSAS